APSPRARTRGRRKANPALSRFTILDKISTTTCVPNDFISTVPEHRWLVMYLRRDVNCGPCSMVLYLDYEAWSSCTDGKQPYPGRNVRKCLKSRFHRPVYSCSCGLQG